MIDGFSKVPRIPRTSRSRSRNLSGPAYSKDCRDRTKDPVWCTFYDYNSWFCYLNHTKNNQISISFLKGKEMYKSYKELDMKGRKMVASHLIDINSEIPEKLLTSMINHAISLNK